MIKIKFPWLLKLLGFDAMFFLLVIFIKDEDKKKDWMLINHEMIHLLQSIELLWIGHWLLYSLNFIVNLFWYRFDSVKAYRNICFEREAHLNEDDEYYLVQRKPYSWTKYL